MTLIIRIGIIFIGILASCYGVGTIAFDGDIFLSCRRGCAMENTILLMFGKETGKKILGLLTLIIGIALIYEGLRLKNKNRFDSNNK